MHVLLVMREDRTGEGKEGREMDGWSLVSVGVMSFVFSMRSNARSLVVRLLRCDTITVVKDTSRNNQ